VPQSTEEEKGSKNKGAGPAVWLVGPDNKPERLKIKTKLSDGTMVGVEAEQDLLGREVIVGLQTAATSSSDKDNVNPFTPKMPSHSVRHAAR